jgi:propanol-preferring alcohol dehydrogenase
MNYTITGSLVGGMQDTDEALAFAARGLIKPQIKVIPFKQLPEGLKDVVASKVAGRLVVDFDA